MAFLFAPNKLEVFSKNDQIGIYLDFLGIMEASTNFLENRMISRTARLTLASLVSASIALSPLSVLAADPAPAPAPAPAAAPASAPAPAAAPTDKAEAKKAKKQAKQQKKAEKKAKKKSKKKAKAAEAVAQ